MKYVLHILCETDEIRAFYEAEVAKRSSNRYKMNKFKDSGVDIYCVTNVTIQAGETKRLDFGIRCALFCKKDASWVPSAFYLVPRSSISKTPLRMSNNLGIIDSGYRGSIMGAVDNIKMVDYCVEKGQRLFQIVAPDLAVIEISLVDELDNTLRGVRGFGSTGD